MVRPLNFFHQEGFIQNAHLVFHKTTLENDPGLTQTCDVAVVGAGPAGTTAARVVAKQGYRTVVIDRRSKVGVPIQCGELIPTPSEAHNLFPHSQRKSLPELSVCAPVVAVMVVAWASSPPTFPGKTI